MRPYSGGPLDRYRIGIPLEVSEICTVYYVVSQPRTSDRLISQWRALCLLAYYNWRCHPLLLDGPLYISHHPPPPPVNREVSPNC